MIFKSEVKNTHSDAFTQHDLLRTRDVARCHDVKVRRANSKLDRVVSCSVLTARAVWCFHPYLAWNIGINIEYSRRASVSVCLPRSVSRSACLGQSPKGHAHRMSIMQCISGCIADIANALSHTDQTHDVNSYPFSSNLKNTVF